MTREFECDYKSLERGGWIRCASFEFDIDAWLIVEDEYMELDGYSIIERTTTCIHCGQSDIVYPV